MKDVWGDVLQLRLLGGSHEEWVGCTLTLPKGFAFDLSAVSRELARRAPRGDGLSTSRRETDDFVVRSGLKDGVSDGTPFTALIPNRDVRRGDYTQNIPRPSHGDYPASVRWPEADRSGGGRFSGRMSAPLVLAGALARQLLSARGIQVGAHIGDIGGINDAPFDPVALDEATFSALDPLFPLVDPGVKAKMLSALSAARESGDSLGGTVECGAVGLPVGLGEPFFGSIESMAAQLLFSIPGIKGVEFGAGFGFSALRGSQANDPLYYDPKGRVRTKTNRSGGVNGGLANGMPLVLRAVFRPVPTLALPQGSIDLAKKKNVVFTAGGRHDVCILPRGCVAVEAALCLALYELLAEMEA